jgi:hypothetical protein
LQRCKNLPVAGPASRHLVSPMDSYSPSCIVRSNQYQLLHDQEPFLLSSWSPGLMDWGLGTAPLAQALLDRVHSVVEEAVALARALARARLVASLSGVSRNWRADRISRPARARWALICRIAVPCSTASPILRTHPPPTSAASTLVGYPEGPDGATNISQVLRYVWSCCRICGDRCCAGYPS